MTEDLHDRSLEAIRQALEKRRQQEELIRPLVNASKKRLCVTCGEKIDPERLKVMPTATRCVMCQREEERRGKPPQQGWGIRISKS